MTVNIQPDSLPHNTMTHFRKNETLHRYLSAAAVFMVGGSVVHLFVMLIEYYLMPTAPHMDLRSDFFGSVLALAMLPMVVTYGACLLGVYLFWQKAKSALALVCKKDAQRREAEHVVQEMQRLTGTLAEHLSAHNAEILLWVERRRRKTGSVPAGLKQSSHKIAEVMKVLSEISFVMPYVDNCQLTVREFETAFLRKLKQKTELGDHKGR